VIKVNTFIVVILHISEICVIVCVCVCAECIGENISRDLHENSQEIV
jgi:hypothetical protein